MMKLNETNILDYLDDRLCTSDCADMEEALEHSKGRSSDVEDARLGMQALHALASEEPIVVSEDFWPRLREKLPEQPPRNAVAEISSTVAGWLWPSTSKWAISARVAAVVAVIAMMSLWLGPQRTVTPSSAISASEKAFISRSMQRHADYVNTPPTVSSLPLSVGDAGSAQHDADLTVDSYIP